MNSRNFPVSRALFTPQALLFIVVLLILATAMVWFFNKSIMITVRPNQVAVVMEYSGSKPPPENGFIAAEPGQMGIQLEVWREGIHFVNPIFTRVEIVDIVRIPENHVGYVVRKFGKDIPGGGIIAGEGEKGVLEVALKPGFYPEYSNPYAYEVVIQEAIQVPPGYAGVVTNLAGPLPETPNRFLSEEGARGVQERHLTPGTYFLNPYLKRVDLVNVQSRRTDIPDLEFPSFDGFPISLNCSVEWYIPEENAPLAFVMFGEEIEVENKIIYPSVLNYSRIIGSSEEATTFISGETRQQFGEELERAIADSIRSVSVEVKETGVRTILPPPEVLSILQDKEIAVQQQQQYLQEITQNAEQLKLQVQKTRAEKEKDLVDRETEQLKTLLDRERAQEVEVLQARREFDAAKVDLEAARNIADASRTLARAEAEAIRLRFEAEAKAQTEAVRAFGEGPAAAMQYARYRLAQNLAPRIGEVFTGTDFLWNSGLLSEEEADNDQDQ